MMMPQIGRQPGVHHTAISQLMYPNMPMQRPVQQENHKYNSQQENIMTRPLFRTSSSSLVPTPSQHNHNQDNLLRRKTPNGTLPAAYDAAPMEWTPRPTKHILLPYRSAGTVQMVQPDNMDHAFRTGGGWDRSMGQPAGTLTLQGADITGVNGAGPSHLWSAHQSSPMPLDDNLEPYVRRFLLHQHQIVPAVPDGFLMKGQPSGFQPLYNPITAPTASCDDMNNYGFGNENYNLTPRENSWYGHYGGWGNEQTTAMQPTGASMTHQYAPLQNSNPAVWQHAIGDSVNAMETSTRYLPAHSISTPSGLVQELQMPITHSDGYSGFSLQNHHSSPNREDVLVWAHKAYVDLLASIHASQRQGEGRSQAVYTTGHSSVKAGLFPRPPQPPRGGWRNNPRFPQAVASASTQGQELPFNSESALDRQKRARGLPDPFPEIGTSSSHSSVPLGDTYPILGAESTTKQPHMIRDSGLDNRKAALDCYSSNTPIQQLSNGVPNGSTFPLGNMNLLSNTTPVISNNTQPSVTTNAIAALDMLDKLCAESRWTWIDGLLLAGCLAYGLGDLHRAMQCYSHILEIDDGHAEALSNLAAAFLSLGRRDEAEQYWRRAVRCRPSYFEAVEHLIGLLCGEHRGREAVEIINFVEKALQRYGRFGERNTSIGSSCSGFSAMSASSSPEVKFDYDSFDRDRNFDLFGHSQTTPGVGGFMIPGCENGRMVALIHAKGNMLYTLGDNAGAAKAFEDAVLVAAGIQNAGIGALINQILIVLSAAVRGVNPTELGGRAPQAPVLLTPDKAIQTARLLFPPDGKLPGLREVPSGTGEKAAVSTTSNSLLSLAKIFQDGMSSGGSAGGLGRSLAGVKEILALYYLSLSLHPSPSTANNVGILLASIQQVSFPSISLSQPQMPGVPLASGVQLALHYYYYGLGLDNRHAHLYTNLGSLLKDINNLTGAIRMYEQAVACDGKFDIALANLANAVKDQGRIKEAIGYYRRAVKANPDFAEAVCGLANALNSVCDWKGRGGVVRDNGNRDRWHVDDNGGLIDAKGSGVTSSGWMKRVVRIVEKQLSDGELWGKGVLVGDVLERFLTDIEAADDTRWSDDRRQTLRSLVETWVNRPFEGSKIIRMIERAGQRTVWKWYQDKYLRGLDRPTESYARPLVPSSLTTPSAPTVLPFHTFTCPLSAEQVRMISERNGLRISCSTLRAPWLPTHVYPPPSPPAPFLRVGYVSSDFNNHPLAHLMQSVFGLHDPSRVKAYCYATTASDNSEHRKQIENEAPVFYDAHSWGADRLIKQIVDDGVHILINLNGFTRGARNEIFAARPAPIQMSFMGFAGTLGAEWCDYLYADSTAVPFKTLRPWRRNVDIDDEFRGLSTNRDEGWVYAENIIFARYTFFCCDHRQSAPDSKLRQLSWEEETKRRWKMRKCLFPSVRDDQVILGNFNQLYKIEPTTFRTWLRILSRVPKAVLWLLRFPDLGEKNLRSLAKEWAGSEVASRIIFTDVAPKPQHISRAQVCDVFLDTPECNAHTTAADVLWSGTPLLTLPRHRHKMCSRIAASILRAAVPQTPQGKAMANRLIAMDDEQYEDRAVELASNLVYTGSEGHAVGELFDIRKVLFENRWSSELFDTRRWVRDLEDAYEEAWRRWVSGEGGDIDLNNIKKSY